MNILLRARLREKTIVAPSGDIVSDLNIAEALRYHGGTGSLCTIVLNPVPEWEVYRFGTALLEPLDGPFGRISEFREKSPPHEALQSTLNGRILFLNNSSFYVLEPEIFLRAITFYNNSGAPVGAGTLLERIFPQIDRAFLAELKAGKIEVKTPEEADQYRARFGPHNREFNDFGSHIFPQLARNDLLRGYVSHEYWNDVGDRETYWFANWDAITQRFRMNIPGRQIEPGVWMGQNVQVIDWNFSIRPPVVLGDNVKIDSGAVVGPFAIIDRDWEIERDAQVFYQLLWRNYAGPGTYPDQLPLQIVRRGTVLGKGFVCGTLPQFAHQYKVCVGDGEDASGTVKIPTNVGLKIPAGSEGQVAKRTKRVLIVDDNETFTASLVETLRQSGWERISTAATFERAEEELRSQRYDLIILDSVLDEDREQEVSDGVRLLREHKLKEGALNYPTPVLFWSGFPTKRAYSGLTVKESAQLAESEGGFAIRNKDDTGVKGGRVSDFLLKLLKIEL